MDFDAFASRVDAIESEPADLETAALVSELFADADADLSTVVRFVQGRVFPAWDSTTLDIGPNLCYAALARAAGPNVSAADVEERLADVGEIGAVAESYELGGQQGLSAFGTDAGSDRLTVAAVDTELRSLAAADGAGSRDRKLDTLFGLFNRCTPLEARYLSRLVLSEMRIGVGAGTVRDSIADAFEVPVAAVERALQVTNDYGRVAVVAREDGETGLSELQLVVGRPVQAMLAQAGTAADALDAWGQAAVETKFDGARVQVHVDGEAVSLFSRNMDDVTASLPEIVEFVKANAIEPAILDGEVVAVDGTGEPLPFQEVLRRFRRKYDVEAMRDEVTLELTLFDCLHADGDDLLDAPLTDRRERLAAVAGAGVSELSLTDDLEEISQFEERSLAAGHEGIMLKNPTAPYSPGDRGQNWLKRKPDVETLDLVVTGAEWGEGRRASFLGTYLLSVRDDDEYRTIGKVATGITDEKLAELTALLEPEITAQRGQTVDIRPTTVFEVGYEEIQRSPTYSSGYALRFPRFLAVREDKSVADAESLDRIARLADDS
ncbi:ATP-dependent DNA ligase LigA [Haloferacaceae archaeon DSL9]